VSPTTPNEIVLSSSPDGVRWTTPARVPTSRPGLHHLLPGLGVDVTTSGAATRLAVAYYTLEPIDCTAATCLLRPWLVASRDAGRSWGTPLALARATALPNLARSNRGRFVGDYISTAFVTGGVAVPVFSTAYAAFDGRFHQGVFAVEVPPGAAEPLLGPALGRVTATPGRPRAGSRFAISAVVSGAHSAPVAVACTLRVGRVAVPASGMRLVGGRARCEWRIPAGAAGRRALGSVAVTTGGRTVRRVFSYVVARAGRP
jgi:hypothetical protein